MEDHLQRGKKLVLQFLEESDLPYSGSFSATDSLKCVWVWNYMPVPKKEAEDVFEAVRKKFASEFKIHTEHMPHK